jgi:hypothetical protein
VFMARLRELGSVILGIIEDWLDAPVPQPCFEYVFWGGPSQQCVALDGNCPSSCTICPV